MISFSALFFFHESYISQKSQGYHFEACVSCMQTLMYHYHYCSEITLLLCWEDLIQKVKIQQQQLSSKKLLQVKYEYFKRVLTSIMMLISIITDTATRKKRVSTKQYNLHLTSAQFCHRTGFSSALQKEQQKQHKEGQQSAMYSEETSSAISISFWPWSFFCLSKYNANVNYMKTILENFA